MRYMYYPGCSLHGTGKPYEESLLAVLKRLGAEWQEIDDWNCCGATAYMSVNPRKAHALASRNLALAEQQANRNGDPVDIMAPCSACYLVLSKAKKFLQADANNGREILRTMESVGLHYKDKVQIRHPLDILVNDIGLEAVQSAVCESLDGMKVVSYYGCQVVRPYATFDDPYNPMSMDRLMEAAGAAALPWPVKTRCCGGSHMGTMQDVGLRLCYILLHEAKKYGAEAVVTACPLCQFNLECYQDEMKKRFGEELNLPVLYFSQLLGKAMGISEKELGMQRLFVPLQRAQTAAASV